MARPKPGGPTGHTTGLTEAGTARAPLRHLRPAKERGNAGNGTSPMRGTVGHPQKAARLRARAGCRCRRRRGAGGVDGALRLVGGAGDGRRCGGVPTASAGVLALAAALVVAAAAVGELVEACGRGMHPPLSVQATPAAVTAPGQCGRHDAARLLVPGPWHNRPALLHAEPADMGTWPDDIHALAVPLYERGRLVQRVPYYGCWRGAPLTVDTDLAVTLSTGRFGRLPGDVPAEGGVLPSGVGAPSLRRGGAAELAHGGVSFPSRAPRFRALHDVTCSRRLTPPRPPTPSAPPFTGAPVLDLRPPVTVPAPPPAPPPPLAGMATGACSARAAALRTARGLSLAEALVVVGTWNVEANLAPDEGFPRSERFADGRCLLLLAPVDTPFSDTAHRPAQAPAGALFFAVRHDRWTASLGRRARTPGRDLALFA